MDQYRIINLKSRYLMVHQEFMTNDEQQILQT